MPQPDASAAAIDARRTAYLHRVVDQFSALEPEMHPLDGRRWALNHGRLVLNQELDAANDYFARVTLTRDADICFIRFLKTFLDFRESPRLSGRARHHLLGLLVAWPVMPITTTAVWPAHHTENHDVMQMTIGLFAERERTGETGNHVRELLQWIAWRFERGFVEWNSPSYQYHVANPLIVLAEQAPSAGLRQAAADLLDLMLAERLVLGLNGYLGGPAFRCRTADANDSSTARKVAYLEDNRYDGFLPTVWLATGLGEPVFDFAHARVAGLEPAAEHYASANEPRLKQDEGMFYACSQLTPHPVVAALAEDMAQREPLTYTGQRYLGWPDFEPTWSTQRWLPGAVTYYNTRHVSLGSLHADGWSHQTRYSEVLFAADPSQGLRVELILPGVTPTKRRHEALGRVVQHGNWLVGQGTLFEDGRIEAQRVGVWDVYAVGGGWCAHFGLPDAWHVLQVADETLYSDQKSFVADLTAPELRDGKIVARSLDGDSLVVDTSTVSLTINGAPQPHPPVRLHGSHALESVSGSGRITVRSSRGEVTYDAGSYRV